MLYEFALAVTAIPYFTYTSYCEARRPGVPEVSQPVNRFTTVLLHPYAAHAAVPALQAYTSTRY